MSKLRFRRPTFYPDRLRKYQLFIDGLQVGEISAGSQVEIPTAAGRHEIMAKIDWCSSNMLQVEVKPIFTGEARLQTGEVGYL